LDVTHPVKRDLYLAVGVSDNGWGIHSEDKEKIFQSLFPIKAASRGTGLGLYMGGNPG
jgi:signal transduction histidine kinase